MTVLPNLVAMVLGKRSFTAKARPAQHCITQFEQRISAPAQAPVQLPAAPLQPTRCQITPAVPTRISVAVDVSFTPRHAESHGRRLWSSSLVERT